MENHCSRDSDQGGEGYIIREEKTSESGQSGGPILVNHRVATNSQDAQPANQNVTASKHLESLGRTLNGKQAKTSILKFATMKPRHGTGQ